MKKSGSKIQDLETAIRRLSPAEQKKLLSGFPKLVPPPPSPTADLDWLKAADTAFAFWNNPEDDIYDAL